jgi:hypothetical protein
MKFFLPTIGTKFRLTSHWQFLLYPEGRNDSLFSAMGPLEKVLTPKQVYQKVWGGTEKVTASEFVLPIGTLLSVDRVYIRQGSPEFDSITMKIFETTHPFVLQFAKKKDGTISPNKARFWVKLCDFNKIEADIVVDRAISHKFAK